ncbi:unnamed protein product [Eruca vesicaria subsp. sativa]|uniref:Uncharacterized protein n=1 Tax=Eruca vesicaria subsp. sativa TaxID=29727 RepID=A0ABC8JRY4_ERUVS|nr:unnamed protein product [Eruca vesicaria subsp. sativa]
MLLVLVKAIVDHGSDFNAAMKSLCPLVSAEESRSHDDVLATALDNLPTSKRSGGFREGVKCTALDEARQKLQAETVAVQQQVESLIKDNALLKRAVAIQHERHNALEDAKQQLELLKQLIPQYQEKLRNLKVNKLRLKFAYSTSGTRKFYAGKIQSGCRLKLEFGKRKDNQSHQ